jgi:hypothetical protein
VPLPWGVAGGDFQLHRWVTITHLAVFDHRLDGFHRPLKVRLYNRDTRIKVAEGVFTPEAPGELRGCTVLGFFSGRMYVLEDAIRIHDVAGVEARPCV